MTNGWIDIKNTDMMLIMGGNPAENHPCGFKWAMEAKRNRNAKLISVDPRFTRTSATADLFLQIRAGTDIAFLGGLLRYAIENNRIAKDYLVNYTNAAFMVKEGFKLPEDGLYSGFDSAAGTYDKSTWNYQEGGDVSGKGDSTDPAAAAHPAATPAPPPLLPPNIAYDLTLQHPRCVFQLLKRQHSRYTPEIVERITGIPKDQFLKAADLFTSVRKDGDMKKAATIIYAVGWTQHTFGTQIIRTAAMVQLLLGNVGRAGGGVNALRGHSNIQGAANPLVGVLRSEGNGAKKSLVCMLCAHEWTFRRIYCPACGEERESQMAFYSAPEIVHVRVDVCDTCHTYLKSIDLTKTGLAVPVVDELATIPLDLWAREHGYEKLQMNLLGT
jgi:formate dehydrogenase major subunit